MVFNSFQFIWLFPVIFVVYYGVQYTVNKANISAGGGKNALPNIVLILISYGLYLQFKPVYAVLLLGITLITYGFARLIEGKEAFYKKRYIAVSGVLLALLPLLIFKYHNFINCNIGTLLQRFGIANTIPGLNWAVPIGISFYSLQAVGYLLDVYHKRACAERNIVNYTLFICFFPQILSGPISTAKELMPQIKATRTFSYEQGRDGLKLLLWGMFIKLVIADRVGMFVDTVYGNYQFYSGNTCLLASLFYTVQIYCDFAGYSWMAMGVAKTLGFNLINNFRQPYLATSITDFWHRWHISLTRWLTTHVYIAMGGSHCSKIKQYWNIMVTFLASGLWHGANWTFVFWGVLHGAFQIIEKALGLDPNGKYAHSKVLKSLMPLRILATFLLVSFAWIFFRMPSLGSALEIIGQMFSNRGTISIVSIYNGTAPVIILVAGMTILVFKDLFQEYDSRIPVFVKKPVFQWVLSVFLFVMILATGVLDGGQFIYASF